MNPFEYIKALDHHAYFIHSFKDSVNHLKDFLKNKFHIYYSKNPDFYYEKFDIFGIDESRKLKEKHSSKSFIEGNKRIFIIESSSITNEAQNSLLKIFEEPNTDSHFFLIMPSAHILLPTLRSRLLIIKLNNKIQDKEGVKEIEHFLDLSKKEKINFVDNLSKQISDGSATKYDAQIFLSNLENVIYKKGLSENKNLLKSIIKAKDYLNDRSPSIKQLLEYVVLNI